MVCVFVCVCVCWGAISSPVSDSSARWGRGAFCLVGPYPPCPPPPTLPSPPSMRTAIASSTSKHRVAAPPPAAPPALPALPSPHLFQVHAYGHRLLRIKAPHHRLRGSPRLGGTHDVQQLPLTSAPAPVAAWRRHASVEMECEWKLTVEVRGSFAAHSATLALTVSSGQRWRWRHHIERSQCEAVQTLSKGGSVKRGSKCGNRRGGGITLSVVSARPYRP